MPRALKKEKKTSPLILAAAKKQGDDIIDKVTFNYIKSNFFRVIHVDGVHGSPTPKGQLQMAIFNERLPIPQQVSHSINKDKQLGGEIFDERVGRTGIIREVEVELLMSLDTAKAINRWLDEQIKQIESLVKRSAVED